MSLLAVVSALPDHLINFRGQLLAQIRNRGHRVIAYGAAFDPLAGAFQGQFEDELKAIGVEYRPLDFSRNSVSLLKDLRLLGALVRQFKTERPQVVFSFHTKPVIHGSIAAAVAKTPRVVSLITGLPYGLRETGKRSPLQGFMAELYRTALKKNSEVVFQNEDDLDFFRDKHLVASQTPTALVNGSGVDLTYYAHKPLPPGPPVFLCVSRLIRSKGIEDFVEAARRVKLRRPDYQFVLVGPWEKHPGSFGEELVNQWKSEGVVEVVGPQLDVRPWLEACHVFVLPSYAEGTPRTVLEAMATGRAVITTDVPGCRQTIVDMESGILVLPRDPAGLATAMKRLGSDLDLAERFGIKARERALAKYDVNTVNEGMLSALQL